MSADLILFWFSVFLYTEAIGSCPVSVLWFSVSCVLYSRALEPTNLCLLLCLVCASVTHVPDHRGD